MGYAQTKTEKPDILLIITDDQRADALECWNQATRGTRESELGYVSSPNLNKLAAEGVLFTHAFCNCPASAPSRASMHTGKYAHHNGIYGFELSHNEYDKATPLITETLRDAGYKTTLFGKLGIRIGKYTKPLSFKTMGYYYDECITMENDLQRKGFTDWSSKGIYEKKGLVGKKEYWYYPDGKCISYFTSRQNGTLTKEDLDTRDVFMKQQNILTMHNEPNGEILGGVNTMPTDKTLDGRIAEEFISYLNHPNQKYKLLSGREINGPENDKPQFYNLSFHFPHTPVMPSKEYLDKFKNKKYKVPAFDDTEFNKMPEQLKKWHNKFSNTEMTPEQKQQHIRDYYAFCAMGDKLIGEAVDAFKEKCKKNNRPYLIIMACGDHGWHLGEQGVTYKSSNYVKSNQTAVIVVSSDKKKFPAGKVVDDLIEYVDFAPTFFTAAGLNVKDKKYSYLDGRDLGAIVSGKTTPRDYVLGETDHVIGHRAYLRGKEFAFSMRVRPQKRLKEPNQNVKWALECSPEDAEMALFDLRKDPKERNNVAYTKEYKKLAEWFRNKLGNIALGDNRLECNWKEKNVYNISDFAKGCDDKKLNIPSNIIPKK